MRKEIMMLPRQSKKEKAVVEDMVIKAVESTTALLTQEYSNPEIISNHEARRVTLDEIHHTLAEQMLKIVKNEENLTPQMIAAISKFLDSNNCKLGVVTAESPMGNLLKNLPFQIYE
jgi:hypothetical protein